MVWPDFASYQFKSTKKHSARQPGTAHIGSGCAGPIQCLTTTWCSLVKPKPTLIWTGWFNHETFQTRQQVKLERIYRTKLKILNFNYFHLKKAKSVTFPRQKYIRQLVKSGTDMTSTHWIWTPIFQMFSPLIFEDLTSILIGIQMGSTWPNELNFGK